MRGALREMWLLAATYDVEVVVRHRPGVELVIPDMLSRAMLSESAATKLADLEKQARERRHMVPKEALLPPVPL